MGKTIAQKGAHVVKDGIRHKDVYATAVGDTAKAYLVENFEFFCHVTLIKIDLRSMPSLRCASLAR